MKRARHLKSNNMLSGAFNESFFAILKRKTSQREKKTLEKMNTEYFYLFEISLKIFRLSIPHAI